MNQLVRKHLIFQVTVLDGGGGGGRRVSLRFGEGQGAERHVSPLPVAVFAAPSLRLCVGHRSLLVPLQRKGIVNAELGCHCDCLSEPGHLWLDAH